MINISVESGPDGIVISITGISGAGTANLGRVKQSHLVEGAGSSSAAAGQHNPDATVAPTSAGAIVIGPIVIPGSLGKASGKSEDHTEPTGPGVTVIGPIVIPGSPGKAPDKAEDHTEPTGPGGH
jgi:hypothetical protein